jgi:hypothetical protein
MILLALQLVGTAVIPLNLTVLVPCVAPKFVPVIVTEEPTKPDVGFRLVMLGTVLLVLLTATNTPALVAVLFDVSVATALSECDPLAVVVLSHANA